MAGKCKECGSVHQFLRSAQLHKCIGVQVLSPRATIWLGLLSYRVDNTLRPGESTVHLVRQNSCRVLRPSRVGSEHPCSPLCVNSSTCSKSGDGRTQTFGLRNRPIRPPDWPLPDTVIWVKYTCRDSATCLFYLQGQT